MRSDSGGVFECRGIVGNRLVDARGIVGVGAGDHAQEEGRVGEVVSEGADLVERAGERDQAIPADPAVGRLEADDAAKGRRLADRAAGVGAESQRSQTGRDGRRRAAGRAAGHADSIPGVFGRPVRAVLRRRAHRELVHVGLAEQDRAGGPELGDHGGVVRRAEVPQHTAAASRRLALDAEHVLDRHGYARETADHFAALSPGVDGSGLGQDALRIEMDENVEPPGALASIQQGANHLFR